MRVFITGGTGFIGTHVVRKLEDEKHELFLLIRNPKKLACNKYRRAKVILGNLSNIDAWKGRLKRFKPDVAIHMAWESLPNYDSRVSVKNLLYGINLFTALSELGCKRVICTGSCWEYGPQSGNIREDAALKPYNAFSSAKNALHWIGREIAMENNMQFIWTRIFYAYGPGQNKESLIPTLVYSFKNRIKPKVKNPFNANDFIHVEDIAEAFNIIVNKGIKSGVYNLGSGKSTKVIDVCRLVEKTIYGSISLSETINLNRNLGEDVIFWADMNKTKKTLLWEPRISIQNGIKNYLKEEAII